MICLHTTEIIFFSNFSSILLIFLNEDFCIFFLKKKFAKNYESVNY